MRRAWLCVALVSAPLVMASWCPLTAAQEQEPAEGTHAEPSIINPTWAFDLTVNTPRPILVNDDRGVPRWYWYAAYKVVNRTGEDRLFIPEITVVDDNGRIVTAGRRIPPAVYPAIAERLGNDLLESPDDVLGRLLQGEDFAKESVAIWPASVEDVDEFTLFFSGVDGETKPLLSPRTGQPVLQATIDPITGTAVVDENGNAVLQPVMVRRTRALHYATPGTLSAGATLREQPIRLVGESTVMR